MDYGLILIVAAYLSALQLATRTNIGPLVCSFIAVGVPFVLGIIIKLIITNNYSLLVFADLFTLTEVITIIVQLAVSFVVFKKIKDEEGISGTIGWAIGGFIVILFLVPFLIQKII